MTKRTYQQFCPIGYSLDLIGERWTLLIIRELWFTPRRFTDLAHQLPGIGPNLLSKRLKELEEGRIIQRRKLPPPAASEVYELTELGLGLKGVLRELSKWGQQLLPAFPPDDHTCGSNVVLLTLQQRFNAARASDVELSGEIRSEFDVIQVDIRAGKLVVSLGLADQRDFVIEINLRPFLALITGQLLLQAVLADQWLEIVSGSEEMVESFLAMFD